MKNLILSALLFTIATSCSTTFYQLYSTKSNLPTQTEENLMYEDDYVKVTYDLWSDGGSMRFLFINKSDQDIILNMDKSFFILNGISYDYYQNRIFTYSSTASTMTGSSYIRGVSSSYGASKTNMNALNVLQSSSKAISNSLFVSSATSTKASSSEGYSVSINEPLKVVIPPNSGKIVSEFDINNTRLVSCDLPKNPSVRTTKKISFTEENSPFIFFNRINYSIGEEGEPKIINHKFFVSEIENLHYNSFYNTEFLERCGEKESTSTAIPTYASPARFYLKYTSSF